MKRKQPDSLISVAELQAVAATEEIFIVDARFKLEDPAFGSAAFRAAHLPGAIFLDLDQDLSSAVVPGETGRHPLPDPAVLEAKLREAGLRKTHRVVVYDDGPGFFAARVWWLLKWLGHDSVCVLDGGLAAWQRAGGEMSDQLTVRAWPGDFLAVPHNDMLISASSVEEHLTDSRLVLLDARSPERFRGDVEPIDPVAGHIPGAICVPCAGNLGADGLFLAAPDLRQRFPKTDEGQALVAYCGSGVTACHNVLAAAVAGLVLPKLYAGSWSEWITVARRPVATGSSS